MPVDCSVGVDDSELPEVVTENNEDTHRRDGECMDFNCGHFLLYFSGSASESRFRSLRPS